MFTMKLNELPAELTKMYMKRSSPIKACALIRYNVTDPSQVVIASTNEVGGNCIDFSLTLFDDELVEYDELLTELVQQGLIINVNNSKWTLNFADKVVALTNYSRGVIVASTEGIRSITEAVKSASS